MKKIILVSIILLSTAFLSHAQTEGTTATATQTTTQAQAATASASATSNAQATYNIYCEIVGTGNLTGTKLSMLQADLGQSLSFFKTATGKILTDESGEKLKFNSMVDALNYMSKRGWKFIQAYVSQNVYHYLLVKEITDESQIIEGLHLKE